MSDNNDKKKNLEPLEILAYAISDGGLWTWWAAEFPYFLQLEFTRTMLYFEPKSADQPPPNQIAIQFNKPKSVTVLKTHNCTLSDKWLDDFYADKLKPFGIDYEYFSFSPSDFKEIVEQADVIEKVFGVQLNEAELLNNTVGLGFWAGDVGIVVLAETMRIITHDGEISIDQIPDRHNKWWNYWRQYWDLRNSDKALPYDPICEITIPAT